MSMTLTPSQFFEVGPHCEAFDALLFQATSQKSSLSLRFSASDVEIAQAEVTDMKAARVHLAELPQVLLDQRTPNAAQVFYPLLGQVRSIDLPAGSIFALRTHTRAIADFWARNLFHALSSTTNVDYVHADAVLRGDGLTPVAEFTKRYLWILRDAIPDSNLRRPDILEKVLLDFHFPIITYENEVFRSGMKALRRTNIATLEDQRLSLEDQKAAQRFNRSRQDLLALLVE